MYFNSGLVLEKMKYCGTCINKLILHILPHPINLILGVNVILTYNSTYIILRSSKRGGFSQSWRYIVCHFIISSYHGLPLHHWTINCDVIESCWTMFLSSKWTCFWFYIVLPSSPWNGLVWWYPVRQRHECQHRLWHIDVKLGKVIICSKLVYLTYLVPTYNFCPYLALFTYIWLYLGLITLIWAYLPLISLILLYVPYSPYIHVCILLLRLHLCATF